MIDDLSREVYGLFGIPIDAVDMATTLRRVEASAAAAAPFLISTANLHFLVAGGSNPQFRESLLISDLCTADGMPVVWLAQLLGIPITKRIAGSDIFEALKSTAASTRRLKVFMFGGAEGAASAACSKLNAENGRLICAGWHDPGFYTVDEMSTDHVLQSINSSNADFLAVALGAEKGQAWLLKNHDRLRVPVRAHLGATINFQAGTLKRAPRAMQRLGLEWLWRIKEEPTLWKRYWTDGTALLRLVVTQLIPLSFLSLWCSIGARRKGHKLLVNRQDDRKSVILSLNGAATAQNVSVALPFFQLAISAAKPVVINFANTCLIDARFFGLLLMLNKRLKRQQLPLEFCEVSPRIRQIFRFSGFEFLLRK